MKFTWGHAIIIFFAIFLTWIISFVIFTLGENNDLVVKDYYKQGAEYSKHMELNKRSAMYKDSISLINTDKGVQITIAPSLMQNTSNKEVYFYCPSGKKNDITFKLAENESISLLGKDKLIPGRYKVSVSWIMAEQNYMIMKDFMVK